MATEKAKPLGGLSNSELASTTTDASEVLSGQTFYSGDKTLKTGTMPNNGAVSETLAINGSYTIPAGYHDGNGTVTQSIPTKRPGYYSAQTSAQTISAGQYLMGEQVIYGVTQSGLTAANIAKGQHVKVSSNGTAIWDIYGTALSGYQGLGEFANLAYLTATNPVGSTSSSFSVSTTLDAGDYMVYCTYASNNGSATSAVGGSYCSITSISGASSFTSIGNNTACFFSVSANSTNITFTGSCSFTYSARIYPYIYKF